MGSHRRLRRDIAELAKDTDGVFLQDSNDLFRLKVAVAGLEGSNYDGGLFKIRLIIPINYPNRPPKAFFCTPVFHPNVCDYDGEICVDILKDKWSPDITLLAACKAMQCLLSEPYPASPLNSAAADMLQMPDMYEETVKIWTKLLAGGTVTTSQKYEEAVEIASALATSTEQAVKLLTKSKWNVQTACDLLAARTH